MSWNNTNQNNNNNYNHKNTCPLWSDLLLFLTLILLHKSTTVFVFVFVLDLLYECCLQPSKFFCYIMLYFCSIFNCIAAIMFIVINIMEVYRLDWIVWSHSIWWKSCIHIQTSTSHETIFYLIVIAIIIPDNSNKRES